MGLFDSVKSFLGLKKYHYQKMVYAIVHFADSSRIKKEFKAITGKDGKGRGFSLPEVIPPQIWVQRGDTWCLGHEMEHILKEKEAKWVDSLQESKESGS